MAKISLRSLSFIGFLICAGALGSAIYIENNFSVSPCPLCELQRIVFLELGCVFLFGMIVKFSKFWGWIYISVAELVAISGLFLAGRQFWLQYYSTSEHISCSASFRRLIETYPFLEALKTAIHGSSDCASIDFTLLGTSLAGWGVIVFGLFCILLPYLYYLKTKQ